MGTTILQTVDTPAEVVRRALTGRDCSVVSMEDRGKTIYVAVRDPDGVSAIVALVEQWGGIAPGLPRTVSYKLIHECEGPHYYGASIGLLDALTPARSPLAQRWRDRCRDHRTDEARKQLAHLRDKRGANRAAAR